MKRIIIIGGGLAGLISAIELAKAGISCVVIEKKSYPFHRVCGEYVSNEVLDYLRKNNLLPIEYDLPAIKRFQLSEINGKSKLIPLDLGGFGISRFVFDHFLYQQAVALGVTFFLNEEVTDIRYEENVFHVVSANRERIADVVIASFGKRSKIDHQLNRPFIKERSPYVGVKYHIKTNHPTDLIALHNFPGGYCGISNIEEKKTTLCYLTHRDNLRRFKGIREMEEAVLFVNPNLAKVFQDADFLFDKPEVINEISFATKAPVENHVLFAGDSAGMIAPLCGNGMAMAIQSARILTRELIPYCNGVTTRDLMEQHYNRAWNKHFRHRLWLGRQVQRLFGKEFTSRVAVSLVMNIRPLATAIVKNTHGEPF